MYAAGCQDFHGKVFIACQYFFKLDGFSNRLTQARVLLLPEPANSCKTVHFGPMFTPGIRSDRVHAHREWVSDRHRPSTECRTYHIPTIADEVKKSYVWERLLNCFHMTPKRAVDFPVDSQM